MVITYAELLSRTRKALSPTEGENAPRIARELTAFAADKTMEALLRDTGMYASQAVVDKLEGALAAYLAGKPLAYIFGSRPFYGLDMLVDERVLIPRDDSVAVTAPAGVTFSESDILSVSPITSPSAVPPMTVKSSMEAYTIRPLIMP